MSLAILNAGAGKKATAMGFFQAIYGIGMFAGPALTGFLGETFNSLSAGFYTLAGIGFLGLILTLVLFNKAEI